MIYGALPTSANRGNSTETVNESAFKLVKMKMSSKQVHNPETRFSITQSRNAAKSVLEIY
jgi:hypothetical protein